MAESRAFDVTIRQAVHPVTSEVLTQAFRSIGEIEQVTVNNPETNATGETTVTAFVVFCDAATGQNAMRSLQGRAIYPNSCYVELKPSAAGSGLAGSSASAPMMGYGGGHHHHHHHHHHGGHHHHHHHHGGYGAMPPQHHHHHHHHGGGFGAHHHHGTMHHHHHHGGLHHHHHHHHGGAFPMRGGMGGGGFMQRGRGFGPGGPPMMMGRGGGAPGMMMGRGGGGPPGMGGGGDPGMAGPGGFMGGVGPGGEPAVLMVSGVPTNVSLMKLFILLEVYGVVLGLRRQMKQPETIIAKFEQYSDAMLCAKLLSGTPFFGAELQLRHFAGFTDRQGFAPAAGACSDPEDAECQTFDFTTTRHRGRPHGHGGVTGRKYSPGPHLFIGNLLETISDAEAKELFTGRGFEVVDWERKSPAHALCSLKDTQAGIDALIATHSVVLKDRFVKVTFSGFAPNSSGGNPHAVQPLPGAAAAAAPMPAAQAPAEQQQQQGSGGRGAEEGSGAAEGQQP